jgi:hypothetical protein
MVPDSEGVTDEGFPARNGDDSTKIVEGDDGPEEPETTNEPMKTMAELAAEHAERQRHLELGSKRGYKPSSRSIRSSRVRRKAADGEGEDEPEVDEYGDLSEPSLSDYHSDSPAPNKKYKATSSKAPSKPTPKSGKKRTRSPDVDEGSDLEYAGSSRSKSTSTRPRPKRTTTTAAKPKPRPSRTASGTSATPTALPASDRVLRSRKGKA